MLVVHSFYAVNAGRLRVSGGLPVSRVSAAAMPIRENVMMTEFGTEPSFRTCLPAGGRTP